MVGGEGEAVATGASEAEGFGIDFLGDMANEGGVYVGWVGMNRRGKRGGVRAYRWRS